MKQEFDYIISGAGSAGCVIANRLSENGKYSVCLLEAGPHSNTMSIKTPALMGLMMFSKVRNWLFHAKTDKKNNDGNPHFCPRGKTLGGSSAVNGMVYMRGAKADYDSWSGQGNTGWSYDEVLPYFKKSEHNEDFNNEFHGQGGGLNLEKSKGYFSVSHIAIAACKEVGITETNDFNGEQYEGVGWYQYTIKNGQRCGTYRAFLQPAMARENLTVITGAQVTKIEITEDTEKGKTATGLHFTLSSKEQFISAKKEVIICNGAFQSPQLLMLSGVGNKEELAKFGINSVLHLPGVGKNLQEHPDTILGYKNKKRDAMTIGLSSLAKNTAELIKYILTKKGYIGASLAESGAIIKSSDEVESADLQVHFMPILFDDHARNFKALATHGYSCHCNISHPKSRGQITLNSANPLAEPNIELNLLSHPDDQKVMVNAIKTMRKIYQAKAFDQHRGEELWPGKQYQSDEELLHYAKDINLSHGYHPVGSCKMGSDEMAVVDHQLKVHGINNLRVADASIMPTIIGGNTNAPTIMIGEKAADMILADA